MENELMSEAMDSRILCITINNNQKILYYDLSKIMFIYRAKINKNNYVF